MCGSIYGPSSLASTQFLGLCWITKRLLVQEVGHVFLLSFSVTGVNWSWVWFWLGEPPHRQTSRDFTNTFEWCAVIGWPRSARPMGTPEMALFKTFQTFLLTQICLVWFFVVFVLPPHSYPSKYSKNAHKWCAVIGKPGSARPNRTALPQSLMMDLGHMNIVLKWCMLIERTPDPRGVSYVLCSLIKNPEKEDPSRRNCYKFEGGLFLRVLD